MRMYLSELYFKYLCKPDHVHAFDVLSSVPYQRCLFFLLRDFKMIMRLTGCKVIKPILVKLKGVLPQMILFCLFC